MNYLYIRNIGKNLGYYLRIILFILILIFGAFARVFSQESGASSEQELANKLANPVSSMISLPFQSNMDVGIGENKGARYTLRIQPVIPVSLTKKVNLIGRLVLPVINQYNITGVGEAQGGLSDANLTFFFSPREVKNGFVWGGGPVFYLPTATNHSFKAKKFGIGPSVVFLKQTKGLTAGLLLNQIWSVAGAGTTDISNLYFQPFFIHNWKSGAGAAINLEGNHNWKFKTTDIWLNVSVSALSTLGKQKVQWQIGPRFNISGPESSRANWGLRAGLTLTFPK